MAEQALQDGTLLIADHEKPLAGIMGSENGVSADMKHLFLGAFSPSHGRKGVITVCISMYRIDMSAVLTLSGSAKPGAPRHCLSTVGGVPALSTKPYPKMIYLS